MNDSELLLAIKNNDQKAFELLYHRYKQELYVHALRIVRDRELVKDLMHEIFLRLWERRHELQVHTQLRAYLYQSMRYKAIDFIEKKKNATAYYEHFKWFTDHQGERADYPVREQMLSALIERQIGQMPPKMQKVFRMSRQEHLSHAKIAELLGLSEQSVRSHIKNALRLLRSKLTIWAISILTLFFS